MIARVTSLEKMAGLNLLPGMKHLTAVHASQISDAAAAVLIASDTAVTRWELTPLARMHAMAVGVPAGGRNWPPVSTVAAKERSRGAEAMPRLRISRIHQARALDELPHPLS